MAAAYGDTDALRCIHNRCLGVRAKADKDVEEIVTALVIAERIDLKSNHVEGVILALLERACGPTPSGESTQPAPVNR